MKVNGMHEGAWAKKFKEEPQNESFGIADVVEILPSPLIKLLHYLIYRNPDS